MDPGCSCGACPLSIPPPHRACPTTACRRGPRFGQASKWRSSANLRSPEKARLAAAAFDLACGAHCVAVRFRSEAARIDLNAAPTDLLAGLFTAVGVNSARAETFAERVVGWRTKAAASADANVAGADGKDDKAPKRTSSTANSTCYIRRATPPFDNTLELSLLPVVSLAVVERVLPFVTVFSGHPEVDVSSADPTVLSAFPEMTPQILGAVLNARVSDTGDGRALLELLGPAKARATTDPSKAFRASIAVEFDNGRRVHAEVVFRLKDQGGKDQAAKDQGDEPYDLLYWRDDFDGPMQSA